MISLDWTNVLPVVYIIGAILALFLGVQGGFAVWRKVTFIQHERAMLAIRRAREEAKTQHILASASATEAIAQHKARLIPVNAGGSFGYLNEETGAVVRPTINANVPNHVSISNTRRDEAPVVGTQDEPYTLVLPAYVNIRDVLRTTRLDPRRLEIVLGISAKGPIIVPFGPDTLHLGTTGASGSGKTIQATSIAFQLMCHDPDARRVKLVFFDLNRKGCKPFVDAPHTWIVADSTARIGQAIVQLNALCDRRESLSETEVARLPIIIVWVDEMFGLRDELPRGAWDKLVRLHTRARQSGVYFLDMSQTFYSDEETRTLKGQIRTRMAFMCEDEGTYRAFGFAVRGAPHQPYAPLLLPDVPKGRFVLRYNGRYTLAQAPDIDPRTVVSMFARSPQPQPAADVRETTRQPDIIIPVLRQAPDSKLELAIRCYRPGMTVRALAAKVTELTGETCSLETAAKAIKQVTHPSHA